jgi:hypothetical protein
MASAMLIYANGFSILRGKYGSAKSCVCLTAAYDGEIRANTVFTSKNCIVRHGRHAGTFVVCYCRLATLRVVRVVD